MLVLSELSGQKSRWVQLPDPLAAMEVEIRHAGPTAQQEFRRKLVNRNILKSDANFEVKDGKDEAFYVAFARQYVSDWRGEFRLNATDEATPAYSPEEMGRVFGMVGTAFVAVVNALAEEAAFFSKNGDGSPG